MSTSFLAGLAVVVLAILTARLIVPALPLRRAAVRVTVADLVLASLGLAGLILHCGAMFFPSVVEALPGTEVAIREINALGITSMILYLVPAVLMMLALRRQHPAASAVAALALTAVGVTMYNGGSLQAHLAAIFVSVVVLAGDAAMLIHLPRRRSAAGLQH